MRVVTSWTRAIPGVLALGWAVSADAAPKAWIDPTVVDLGIVEEGKLFERFVEVKNVGDGVLLLEDLKTSCGCTAATVDGEVELTAGKSQKVRLTFNTRNMDGPVEKIVTVTTNDPVQPGQTVQIKAVVHKPVRVNPKFLELRNVGMKGPWEQMVRLESDTPLGLKIVDATVLGGKQHTEPSKTFDVNVSAPRKDGDRDVHEVAVSLRTPAKPSKISEVLLLVTNQGAPHDSIRITLRGEVLGRLRASSGFVVLKGVDPGESTRQDITIVANEGTFKVLSAEVPNSPVQVTVQPPGGGKQAVVSVTYLGRDEPMNGVRNLIIKTDDPDQARIEIPVRFQTKGPRTADLKPEEAAKQAAAARAAAKAAANPGATKPTDVKPTEEKPIEVKPTEPPGK